MCMHDRGMVAQLRPVYCVLCTVCWTLCVTQELRQAGQLMTDNSKITLHYQYL